MFNNYKESQRARMLAHGTYEAHQAERAARLRATDERAQSIIAFGNRLAGPGAMFIKCAVIGAGLAFGASLFL